MYLFSFCGSPINYEYDLCESFPFFGFKPFFRELACPLFCFYKRRWLEIRSYTANVCCSSKLKKNICEQYMWTNKSLKYLKGLLLPRLQNHPKKSLFIFSLLHQTSSLNISAESVLKRHVGNWQLNSLETWKNAE